ncbi:MAG: PASTA domain-containing protein, partial [Oscillospiraceae bacterium]|nr:PASTA domain-containing protein [Candidatus Equicaccousia limihippi]
SCNPFFISLGQTIGVSTFSKYFKAFGLTEKTGIDLPGEATSQYHSEKKMGPTELASTSFGQTFKITPIQLITALSATVNGGKLLTPHVVIKIVDTDGNIIKNNEPQIKRQVISKQTSDTVCKILESVVDGGGGKNAYVAGYRIGGKTGTSQKVAEMLASGKSGLYVASFVGFAPMDDPEIAVLVLLDEPHGSNYYGGTISAPVGGQILSEILPYLGAEPQYTAEQTKNLQIKVPDVKGKKVSEAKSKLSSLSLSYKIVGKGENVVKQLPASTQTIYKNGIVILYTDEKEAVQKAPVPNLIGLSISEVNSTAVSAGFNVTFKGNTKTSSAVVSYMQSVEPNTQLDKGSV